MHVPSHETNPAAWFLGAFAKELHPTSAIGAVGMIAVSRAPFPRFKRFVRTNHPDAPS